MRVIAGTAKGRRLQMVPGDTTRPITDRAKEALFSILGPELEGASVLDLFAGTGAVGIEALSRGAESACFIDRAPQAIRTIHTNLATTGFAKASHVLRRDTFSLLAKPATSLPDFDPDAGYELIYVAPPQYKQFWLKTMLALDAQVGLLAQAGQIIVQIHPKEDEAIELKNLVEFDRRKYGSVLLMFYERRPDSAMSDSADLQ